LAGHNEYLPINCRKHKLSIFLSPAVAGAEGILKFKYKIKCPIEIGYNEHPRQRLTHSQWTQDNFRFSCWLFCLPEKEKKRDRS